MGGGPTIKEDSFGFTEGGLVHAISALANLTSDYDVKIVCPNLPESTRKQTIKHKGVTIVCLESPRWVRWMRAGELSLTEAWWRAIFNWPTMLANYMEARKYAEEEKPDILIGNGIIAASLLRFIPEGPFKIGIIHHLYHAPSGSDSSKHTVQGIGLLERLALRLTKLEKIGVVNPMVKDILVKRGIRQDKIVVVGNGVNIDDYFFCENKNKHSLIYIGSLRKLKRVSSLIDVISRIKSEFSDVTLHIVGDGPEHREVNNKVISSGLSDSIVMHGYLSEGEKIKLLASSEIYVSNSGFEGFGIPVIEAMATGTVPVISNIASHKHIFQGEDVGYLVNNTEEMVASIVDLLTNETKRLQLAQAGRKLVEERWTWTKVGEKYRELIQAP